MKLYDLSHTIHENMPVYPGTEQPLLEQSCTIENDGFAEKKLSLTSHIGTHMDAPSHILTAQKGLDAITLESFFGRALLIKTRRQTPNTDHIIEAEHLEPYAQQLKDVDFVVFHTGWNKNWGSNRYFSNYPTLSEEAARFLCQFDLKGVGFDTISADKEDSKLLPIHRILLHENIVIVENMTNLEAIPDCTFILSCLPLKIKNCDGSPIRAVAICNLLEDEKR